MHSFFPQKLLFFFFCCFQITYITKSNNSESNWMHRFGTIQTVLIAFWIITTNEKSSVLCFILSRRTQSCRCRFAQCVLIFLIWFDGCVLFCHCSCSFGVTNSRSFRWFVDVAINYCFFFFKFKFRSNILIYRGFI